MMTKGSWRHFNENYDAIFQKLLKEGGWFIVFAPKTHNPEPLQLPRRLCCRKVHRRSWTLTQKTFSETKMMTPRVNSTTSISHFHFLHPFLFCFEFFFFFFFWLELWRFCELIQDRAASKELLVYLVDASPRMFATTCSTVKVPVIFVYIFY